MPSKRTLARVGVLFLCLAMLVPLGPSWANHAGTPGPVHAGNTYGWYPAAWREEFVGPLKSAWHTRGKGSVRTKNGMLTLKTGQSGSLSTTLSTSGHETGRWEIRWKNQRYGSANAPYTVRTELVPAGDRPQYCGARNIALESYTQGRRRANFYIHNLPDAAFVAGKGGTAFGGDHWHTFAVEVTSTHISWFVDAHVVSTERRPEAISGVPLTVQFSMRALPGRRMSPARMQMDWLRYWSLAKPNDKSIAAPAPRMTTFARACPPA